MQPVNGESAQVNGSGVMMRYDGGAVTSVQASTYMPAMSMEIVVARRNAVVQFTREIMTGDVDYGVIPGTQKPTLLKPGAEKLNNFFGLEPIYEEVREVMDWTGGDHGGEPLYYIRYRCRLTKDGRVWGSGEGSSNTWETKHRFRWAKADDVPASLDLSKLKTRGGRRMVFEPEFAIQKSETGGKYGKPAEYWEKFKFEIGAGRAKKTKKALGPKEFDGWEIGIDELQYRVPNPDFADLINTIQKMAQKRALIAATLIATSASEFFTQDMEDLPRPEDVQARQEHPTEREPVHPVDPPPAATQAKTRERKAKPAEAAPPAPPVPPPPPVQTAKAEETTTKARYQGTDDDLPPNMGGPTLPPPGPTAKPWKTFREMTQVFEKVKEMFIDAGYPEVFVGVLAEYAIKEAREFKSTNDATKAFKALQERFADLPAADGDATNEPPPVEWGEDVQ